MTKTGKNRIDKWLWAVRIFKTRSIASEHCKTGKVKMNDKAVKPAAEVALDAIIVVRKNGIYRTFKVKDIIQKRVSAKLAVDFVEDITPQEELDKLLKKRMESAFVNSKKYQGKGRPTKKDRREIDKWLDDDDL